MALPILLSIVPNLCLVAYADFEAEIRAAGSDTTKIVELARKWNASGDEPAANAAWSKVLQLDQKNDEAHQALKHHAYDGRWFATFTELYRYRREQDARMLADKGLVRFRDQWVPQADARFLRLGFAKDESGAWCNQATLARTKREKELTSQGFQQQELTWIPPAEFESWRKGLWKCGQDWLDKPAADTFHSRIPTWWEVPSEHFVVCSTLGRDDVEWAKWYADATYDDLVRIFGVAPGQVPTTLDLRGAKRDKPTVVVLRTMEQYNVFAAGDATIDQPVTELEGFSSLHYAYFASAWFDARQGETNYRGAGVAFWDKSDEKLAPFGQHSIRHAAAQSFLEAIDPSWNALAASGQDVNAFPNDVFWSEKRIPRWLRYGAASYCERYFIDAKATNGVDPRWAREWGFKNLQSKGGLNDLDKVFEFHLALDDIEGSVKLIHDAGAVVAYILDGGDKKVAEAHAALCEALRGESDTSKQVDALQKALSKSEGAIGRFAKP